MANSDCFICMEPLKKTNQATLVCGHKMHSTCFAVLARHTNNCPLCRESFCGAGNDDFDFTNPNMDNDPYDVDYEFLYEKIDPYECDHLHPEWPPIPNTWAGYNTEIDGCYEYYLCRLRKALPISKDVRSKTEKWEWLVFIAILVWYVFSNVVAQIRPEIQDKIEKGISKRQLNDYFVAMQYIGGFPRSWEILTQCLASLEDKGLIHTTVNKRHFRLTGAAALPGKLEECEPSKAQERVVRDIMFPLF